MAYQDFLEGFVEAQNLHSVDALLNQCADQYRFQIKSRERAKYFIEQLKFLVGYDFAGKRVLDIGCAYGSFGIEMSHSGAHVTGIEVSEKWLGLAALNAKGEADVRFIRCDASSRSTLHELKGEQFDLIVINDVLEHAYDTAGLLHNCRELLSDGGLIYFKVPNGLATQSVISEGHKKVFGISLLPPDYWHLFVKAPFKIYYRRLEYFQALFAQFGFQLKKWSIVRMDLSREITRKKILADKAKITALLEAGNFDSEQAYEYVREAIHYYFREMDEDLSTASASDLYLKYRPAFWEGILEKRGDKKTSDSSSWNLGSVLLTYRWISRLVRRRLFGASS